MVQMGRRLCLTLLAACLALTAAAGCFGVSQNPNYFPSILCDGDIIRTHAKPPGPAYFADFDPHACRVEVVPIEATNPVRTQHLLIATVFDEENKPRRGRRVEWMLEGVGNIIEVDESGVFPGRGYKVDNHYAVSYTDYKEHCVSRGTGNPNDDFVIQPGQSWCVISSAVEGDSHLTVYCPEIHNWDHHKVFVTKHWVDAEWIFPKPAVNRAGTEHVFTTCIFRHTDRQPLANYRVRYRILDGPPAFLTAGPVAGAPGLSAHGQEAIATSDLNGNASVTLAQVAPVMGVNHIGIEIIRPPDPLTPSGAGMVIGRGQTFKEWQAPQVALNKTAPSTVVVNQELPYTITVTNTGKVETKALTVQDPIPASLLFVRADPPPVVDGDHLVWTLGELQPGQSRTMQVVFRTTRPGTITNTASVVTDEGLKDQKSVTTEVTTPGLKVVKTGPATGVTGIPITYDITVSNPGGGPATNVVLEDTFDAGLEHETKANPVKLTVGTLGPRESRTIKLALTPRQAGSLVNRVVATADGGLADHSEHTVVVQEARLGVQVTGPAASYVGRPATWTIKVTNPGETVLGDVTLRDLVPPELSFTSASDGGRLDGGQVVWTLGSLQPKETKTVQVSTKSVKMSPQVLNVAVAKAAPGLEAQDKAALEIRGVPAYRLELVDMDDPVEVGNKTTYKIDVTNQGSLPGHQVQITCYIPPEMEYVDTQGTVKPQVNGRTVTFPAVDALKPQETVTYLLDVRALKAGDARFKVELRSTHLGSPVIKEESTTIYKQPDGTRPPAATSPAPAPAREPAAAPPAPIHLDTPAGPTPAAPAGDASPQAVPPASAPAASGTGSVPADPPPPPPPGPAGGPPSPAAGPGSGGR
jgi:uncharacterized repeat protein (TIGR01451 family)